MAQRIFPNGFKTPTHRFERLWETQEELQRKPVREKDKRDTHFKVATEKDTPLSKE
jgi:hypothetical protein